MSAVTLVDDALEPVDPLEPAAPGGDFEALGVPHGLVKTLASRGIEAPLPIQAATIPDALAGRDVCGKAPTGSGKTLAFALPIALKVRKASPHRPKALVLAPTRELAEQIARELKWLCAGRGRRVHSFYGGVGFPAQLKALRDRVDVAVACPGRLEDLMSQGAVKLSEVELVVVDEADRMADMGFLPAVRRILDLTHPARQTLLFSATLDGEIDTLTKRYQRDPVRHEVAESEEGLTRMTHTFHGVVREERTKLCASVVSGHESTVVFVRTRHGADRVARQLSREGLSAVAIHGDRSQRQRERALADFRSGKASALVATDVAARGIHVDDVSCVIHYDLPADAKDYVHRSGRTARAGSSGAVVSFVTPGDERLVRQLREQLALEVELVGLGEDALAPRSRAGRERPASKDQQAKGAKRPQPRRSPKSEKTSRTGEGSAPDRGPRRAANRNNATSWRGGSGTSRSGTGRGSGGAAGHNGGPGTTSGAGGRTGASRGFGAGAGGENEPRRSYQSGDGPSRSNGSSRTDRPGRSNGSSRTDRPGRSNGSAHSSRSGWSPRSTMRNRGARG